MFPSIALLALVLSHVEGYAVEHAGGTQIKGLHSVYTIPGSDVGFHLHVHGHEGPVMYRNVSNEFEPSDSFQSLSAHGFSVKRSDGIQERDICTSVSYCAGQAASSVAAWSAAAYQIGYNGCGVFANGIKEYFTQDDWINAKNLLMNTLATLVVTVPQTYMQNSLIGSSNPAAASVPMNLNAKFQKVNEGPDDACNNNDPATAAQTAAQAVYAFCLAIQTQKLWEADTHYDRIDSTTVQNGYGADGVPVFDASHGENAFAQFFVSEQAYTFGKVCNALGVNWRERLRRAIFGQ